MIIDNALHLDMGIDKLVYCSDVDATMLECIAFSCPNLESMEIYASENAVNRITGYGLTFLLSSFFSVSTLFLFYQ